MVGRMFKFIGKLIRKGNENYFEIKKENEKPMRISLTISITFINILICTNYSIIDNRIILWI